MIVVASSFSNNSQLQETGVQRGVFWLDRLNDLPV